MTEENPKNDYSLKNERRSNWPFVFLFVLMGLLVFVDQVTKFVIFRSSFPAPRYIGIEKFYNANFAFSIPLPHVFIYILYGSIMGAIVWYLVSNFWKLSLWPAFGWTLVCAGAIANIGERLLLGRVRDFIYIYSGIFNLADGYIIMGIILLVWQSTIQDNQNSKRTP